MNHMHSDLNSHVLTEGRISVTVIPALGGRITSLIDLKVGREWLWRNHHNPLQPVPPGAEYDSVWQGGFEELFPSDAPMIQGDLNIPDHGELWTAAWDVTESSGSSLTMSIVGPVTGVEVSKELTVSESALQIKYQLQHNGDADLPFLFKLHPAFAIDEHCRIDMPGGLVEKVESGFGNLIPDGSEEGWPTSADLARCRPWSSETNEFVYVSELPEGRCGLTDLQRESWVRLGFSREQFPFCWLFLTYGGWRRHNVVVLEPCSNYPKDLEEAIAHGTHARLRPGELQSYEVAVSVGDTA